MAKQSTLTKQINDNIVLEKSVSLSDIISEYSRLAEKLELEELTPELEKQLEITEENIKSKFLGYKFVIEKNKAIINSVYKAEIERLSSKIKRLEKSNEFLNQRCAFAAEIFGINNKYTSPEINVSSVEKIILKTNEEELKLSLEHIIQTIASGDITNCTIEDEYFNASMSIDASVEELCNFIDSLKDEVYNDIKHKIKINVSLKRNEVLNTLQTYEEINSNLRAQYEELLKTNPDLKEPEYRKLEIKGLSLGSTKHPRFS